MRIFLTAVLALLTLPWSQPLGAEVETVRLLVPAGTELGLSTVDADTGGATGWARIEVPIQGSAEKTAAALAIESRAPVLVEQRYELVAPQDDAAFGDQWYLENTGQSGGTADADIDSITAWGSALGEGVVVALIDSGVNTSHPDLDGQIWSKPVEPANGLDDDGNILIDDYRGWDFVDNDNDPGPSGTNANEGHGTAVAGVIAAEANGVGTVGVAPDSTLMVIRSCSEGGCWSRDIADGIYYAIDEGADVINLSLGSITSADDPPLEEAINYARSKDVLVVTAAGNETPGIDLDRLPIGEQLIPGGLPLSNILTVTASDRRDVLAGFSNYGPVTVDMVAPGVDILTTGVNGNYVTAHGTSFASPLVAGVAALLLSKEPGMGHRELFARITSFVDRPSGVTGASSSGRVNAGRVLTEHFIDTSTSVFADAIDWLAEAGITRGCNPPENHRYCPGERVTRGQMAVFLARAFHLPATTRDYFDDDDEAFYENAANRMRAAGLTVGCSATRYCGADQIRREEMAAMLSRALSLPGSSLDHFVDDEESAFETAIDKIAEAGITVGCNPPRYDRFCPDDRVTRGQMAAFIQRSVNLSGSS